MKVKMIRKRKKGLDVKDHKILNVLYNNSRLSCREVAKITGIPVMTVLNRIKKMEQEGVILEYTIRVNPIKLGYYILAYILVAVDYELLNQMKSNQQSVVEELINHPNVSVADLVTGPDRDILIKIKSRSINELNKILDEIRAVKGVNRTDTMTILFEARKACLDQKKFKRQKTLIHPV